MTSSCHTLPTPCLDNSSHAFALLNIIRASFRAHESAGELLVKAVDAYDVLEKSSQLRNILMCIPPSNEPAASMHSVSSFYFSNEDHELSVSGESAGIICPRTIRKRKRRSKVQDCLCSIFSRDKSVSSFFKRTFVTINRYHLFSQVSFLTSILGGDFTDLGESKLSMQTVFCRLQKTEDAMISNLNLNFRQASRLGLLWQSDILVDRLPSLLKISSEFPSFLNDIARKQFLDVILKICVPGVVSPDKRQSPAANCNPVKGVDLLSRTKALCGTVLIWDEFLSPEFRDGYYKRSGFSSLEWLREPNQHLKGKERLLRFEAKGADYEHPFYLIYGHQRTAKLIKSAPISTVGELQILMANYVESLYHHFVKRRLVQDYGRSTAHAWMPTLHPTDSVVQSLNGQFSWHSDAKEMLVNECDSQNNSTTMSVTTFTMNNCPNIGAASLCYREKADQIRVASIPLGPTALHFQLIGTQGDLEHSIEMDPSKQNLGCNMRWTSSCRSTAHLQEAGMKRFLENTSKIDIPTFGDREHYSFYEVWRRGDYFSCSPFLGIPTFPIPTQPGQDHSFMEATPSYYARKNLECTPSVLPSTRKGNRTTQLCVVKKSFTPGKWKLRTNEAKHWPQLHSKRVIQLTESLAEFLTSGRAVKYLNAHKLTITVHIPTRGGTLLAVPHPPLWNHSTNRPVTPGSYFPLLYVCHKHGLAYNTRGSSTWRTDHRCLVMVILYHDYKSALPFSEKLMQDLNDMAPEQKLKFNVNVTNVQDFPGLFCPRIELFLVDNKEPGKGFSTMGGGGNPFSTGSYCATGAAATAGADFYAGANQSLQNNNRNLAMNTKFEGKGRVSVFVCGDFIPPDKRFLPGTSVLMCRYVAAYECDGRSVNQDSRHQLRKEILLYEQLFECKLDQRNMHYRMKEHYLFGFKYDCGVPYWSPTEDWSHWTHLHVRSDDERKLCVEVPAGCLAEKIFSITDETPLFDEDTLYQQFFEEQHYKCLRSLCVHSDNYSSGRRQVTVPSECEDATIQPPETNGINDQFSYCHVQANIPCEQYNEAIHGSNLFRLQIARTCSPSQFLIHMRTLSVAVSCRILRINVDDHNLLGPLLDPCTEDTFILSSYKSAFASDDTNPQPCKYMTYLSSIHQLIAMPSPLRAHDPKVSFLLECVGHDRHLRQGLTFIKSNRALAADLLFQCILVETIGKVTYLIELSAWLNSSQRKSHKKIRLPTIDECPLLIEYFQASLPDNDDTRNRMNNWLHSQYQQDAGLHDPVDYINFLTCVAKSARGYIDGICDNSIQANQQGLSIRGCHIEKLCALLVDKCGCRSMERTRFQCAQVVANMEELVSDLPFGVVQDVILGHGSSVGRSILTLKAEDTDGLLDKILLLIQGLSCFELHVLALYRDDAGFVRLKLNNRVCNRVDAEHMLCKLYIIYERLKGGSRSASVTPKLCFDHCHPCPTYNFPTLQPICRDVVIAFQLLVDNGCWEYFDEFDEAERPRGSTPHTEVLNHNLNGSNGLILESFRGYFNKVPRLETDTTLLIGAVYGSMATTMEGILSRMKSKEMSVRFGRDLGRILTTESECNVRVFTMDCVDTRDNNTNPRVDRHMGMDVRNMSELSSVKLVKCFAQIVLDFVWFNSSYWKKNLGPSFMSKVIPFFSNWLNPGGAIYLPVCSYFIVQMNHNWDELHQLYAITFVVKQDLNQIYLHRGTKAVDESKYHVHFGKEANQVDKLTISHSSIRDECESQGFPYKLAYKRFVQIHENPESVSQIRFLKLEKLNGADLSMI